MKKKLAISLMSLSFSACGGEVDIYNNRVVEEDMGSDAKVERDTNVNNANNLNNVNNVRDMSQADVGPDVIEDMAPDMEVRPTTNAPQEGPNVASQINNSCSTISVKGISEQLMDQMNCEVPGIMKSFVGAPSITWDLTVFPFLQGPATDTLADVAAGNPGTINLNSATRTLAQQYLLWSWYYNNPRLCNANLAAAPGNSNHNGGLAIDIDGSGTWKPRLNAQNFVDNVGGEPWHFFYNGGGTMDVRSLSVLAFQKLYNLNFPENPIDEDGLYGPQTTQALRESPSNGFTREPTCPAVNAFVHYPWSVPLDVNWRTLTDSVIEPIVISSSGIRTVEYRFGDEVLATVSREESRLFTTVLELPESTEAMIPIEIVGFDEEGNERNRDIAFVNTKMGGPFARPLGGGGYETGIDGESTELSITVEVDDGVIETEPTDGGVGFWLRNETDLTLTIEGTRYRFEVAAE